MKCSVMPLALVCALTIFASCDKNDDNNSSSVVNGADSAFTPMAAMSNYAEISAGELALTKSTDTAVLAFASHMISDHTKAQDSLKMIASALNLRAPDSLNAEQAATAALLKTYTGSTFDSAYIFSEVTGHIKTIGLLNTEMVNGNNARVKEYVNRYLPGVEMHKVMADTLAARY